MEFILTILAGTVMACAFFLVYRFGVKDGREQVIKEYEKNTLKITKENAYIFDEYAKMMNYYGGD